MRSTTGCAYALASALALAIVAPASAQVAAPESNLDTLPRFGATPDWRATVGVAAVAAPTFDGAEALRVQVVPDFDVRWRNRFFASVRTGAGWNVATADGWRAGPYVKLDFGRDEGRSAALKGLGDVDPALDAGVFAERTWRFARASIEVRRGLGADRGAIAELGGDLKFRLSEAIGLSAGPRIRLADGRRLATYFGVDAAQAAKSGLPQHTPAAGFESAGFAGAIVVRPTPATTITLFGEQTRLLGGAASSPLVQRRGAQDQTRIGISVGAQLGRAP